jgi:KDO2-lipid IV(A) lauroyltransferase
MNEILRVVFYYLLPLRRSVIVKNLKLGFPNLSVQQREKLIEECYRFMGKQLCILARSPHHFSCTNIGDHIAIDFPPDFAEDVKAGGVILTSGHIGMWELCPLVHNEAQLPAFKQKDCLQIYQPLHNQYVDRMFLQVRARCGNLHLVSTRQPSLIRVLQDALVNGAVVGLVADQRPSKKGIMAPFMGVPAMFSAGMGVLHERTGVPVWSTALLLNNQHGTKQHFSLVLQRITPKGTSQDEDSQWTAAQVVSEYAKQCSAIVREHPSQYLWLHDRWKTPRLSGSCATGVLLAQQHTAQ